MRMILLLNYDFRPDRHSNSKFCIYVLELEEIFNGSNVLEEVCHLKLCKISCLLIDGDFAHGALSFLGQNKYISLPEMYI